MNSSLYNVGEISVSCTNVMKHRPLNSVAHHHRSGSEKLAVNSTFRLICSCFDATFCFYLFDVT